jgi:hypothetical protein
MKLFTSATVLEDITQPAEILNSNFMQILSELQELCKDLVGSHGVVTENTEPEVTPENASQILSRLEQLKREIHEKLPIKSLYYTIGIVLNILIPIVGYATVMVTASLNMPLITILVIGLTIILTIATMIANHKFNYVVFNDYRKKILALIREIDKLADKDKTNIMKRAKALAKELLIYVNTMGAVKGLSREETGFYANWSPRVIEEAIRRFHNVIINSFKNSVYYRRNSSKGLLNNLIEVGGDFSYASNDTFPGSNYLLDMELLYFLFVINAPMDDEGEGNVKDTFFTEVVENTARQYRLRTFPDLETMFEVIISAGFKQKGYRWHYRLPENYFIQLDLSRLDPRRSHVYINTHAHSSGIYWDDRL